MCTWNCEAMRMWDVMDICLPTVGSCPQPKERNKSSTSDSGTAGVAGCNID